MFVDQYESYYGASQVVSDSSDDPNYEELAQIFQPPSNYPSFYPQIYSFSQITQTSPTIYSSTQTSYIPQPNPYNMHQSPLQSPRYDQQYYQQYYQQYHPGIDPYQQQYAHYHHYTDSAPDQHNNEIVQAEAQPNESAESFDSGTSTTTDLNNDEWRSKQNAFNNALAIEVSGIKTVLSDMKAKLQIIMSKLEAFTISPPNISSQQITHSTSTNISTNPTLTTSYLKTSSSVQGQGILPLPFQSPTLISPSHTAKPPPLPLPTTYVTRPPTAPKIHQKSCSQLVDFENHTTLLNNFCKRGEMDNAFKVLVKMIEGGFQLYGFPFYQNNGKDLEMLMNGNNDQFSDHVFAFGKSWEKNDAYVSCLTIDNKFEDMVNNLKFLLVDVSKQKVKWKKNYRIPYHKARLHKLNIVEKQVFTFDPGGYIYSQKSLVVIAVSILDEHMNSFVDINEVSDKKVYDGAQYSRHQDLEAFKVTVSTLLCDLLHETIRMGVSMQKYGLWVTSPATELEVIVFDSLAKMLDMPYQFLSSNKGDGVIQNQVHSCFQKTSQIAGIYPESLRVLTADLSPSLISFFLCAIVGTTSSTLVEPLLELRNFFKENKMWFHMDVSYTGSACLCLESHHYKNSADEADSTGMNNPPLQLILFTSIDILSSTKFQKYKLLITLSTNVHVFAFDLGDKVVFKGKGLLRANHDKYTSMKMLVLKCVEAII